ncbi:stalk domain-containing protein [Paenibacillus sp. 1P07SE]|uniref:stalk domain-containing protein n=1 Tax=Paenibacillus sp. 1P07SE TaxID=3132209 RepID=UPI0039A5C6EF
MKFRKIVVLLLILSLWGGTMLFADSASQRVRVVVNGSEVDEAGLLRDGKTYLPLRQLATTLQSLIEWNESAKRVSVYKPNVHMFLFQDKTIFGNVKRDSRPTFNVHAQVDSLKVDISAVKVTISDPGGRETLIHEESVTSQREDFWLPTKEIRYHFDSAGKYTVRFYMKPTGTGEWAVVSEKSIVSQ